MSMSIESFFANEDKQALSNSAQSFDVEIPKKVDGRVAHVDGDYLAYLVSADRKDEEPTTMVDVKKHTHEFLDHLMLYSGATSYVLHLTQGDKGGRDAQALLKPYQQNRTNKEKPLLLGDCRRWMAKDLNTFVCTDAEADDSMTEALFNARMSGEEDKTVLISQDKDLRMVAGWHLNWMTMELYKIDTTGKLWIEEKVSPTNGKTTKKLRGTGGMWFFAQLLVGDTADNISGLPKLSGQILNKIKPTAPITKAFATLADDKATEKQKEKAEQTLAQRKAGLCGEMTTYEYLKDCETLQQAYAKVLRAYFLYDTEFGFVDYDGNPITLTDAFMSECKLLYMRHRRGEWDFLEFLTWIKKGEI